MIITHIRHDDVLLWPTWVCDSSVEFNSSLDKILQRGRNRFTYWFIWRRCQCVKIIQRLKIGRSVNNEVGKPWKEESWPKLKYYTEIFLTGLRKTTKNLSWEGQSLDTVAQAKESTPLLRHTIMNQFQSHQSSQPTSATFILMLDLTSYKQTFPRSFSTKIAYAVTDHPNLTTCPAAYRSLH